MRTTSRATITKPIHSRPRINQLTTERFEKEGSDVFYNPLPPKKLGDLIAWKVTGNTKAPDFPTPEQAAKIAPSVKIDLDKLRKRSVFDPTDSTLLATWMGHASFFVQVDGVNILTDPVFSERASPVSFAGPKRYVPVPCKVEELPRVDIVTISHNHYDHLDTATVEMLHKTFNPIFVVPRGMKSRWFTTLGWPQTDVENRVVELGWYKAIEIAIPSENNNNNNNNNSSSGTNVDQTVRIVQVTFCPAQHWCQRGITDRNKELWGTFVVEHYRSKIHENHTNKFFYYPTTRNAATNTPTTTSSSSSNPTFIARWFHSGDTGYNEKFFKEIGQEFGRPDVNDTSSSPVAAANTTNNNIVQDSKSSNSNAQNDDDQQQQEDRKNNDDDDNNNNAASKPSRPEQPSRQLPPLFDLALIPIGAYHPRWFLSDQHIDPDQAVIILQELGMAKLALGMHFGTYILTDEPLDEPPKLLKESCEKRGVKEGVFIAPKHGESYVVPL